MTVRWKPLLVLSAVFLVTAVAGVTAIALVLMPSHSRDILPKARAEAKTGQFDRAWIQYRRALQTDGQNPKIHMEVADMLALWAEKAPAEKQGELRQQRLTALSDAARYGPREVAPRRQLVAEALRLDEMGEAVRWSKELLLLAPDDPDAQFTLTCEALSQSPPAVQDARKHLETLSKAEPDRVRTTWLHAWIARAERDDAAQNAILDAARALDPAQVTEPIDRLALLRLLASDAQRTTEPEALSQRIPPFQAVAQAMAAEPNHAAGRIGQLSEIISQVRAALVAGAAKAETPAARDTLNAHAEGIDQIVETSFKKAIDDQNADLRLYQAYADYLLDRERYDVCLEVAAQGLKRPAAALAVYRTAAMGLRESAIRAALAGTDEDTRFEKAAPYLKEMLASPVAREQGIGHLFQGAIDLERSGLAGVPTAGKELSPAEADKLRVEALSHLKQAAAELPQLATAQALYGITLILSREPALGRQYLQSARKTGPLEAKYQIWAAWSMVQAGYPEEAESIVNALALELKEGRLPEDLNGALRVLEGEIAQARRNPEDLKKARAEYQKALASNPDLPVSIELKLVQIDIQLKDYDAALDRIDRMRKAGKGNAGIEQLAVVALQTAGRDQEARETLDKARTTYPDSGELACLDAALKLRAEENEAADQVLANYLAQHPDHTQATNLRSQILAEQLQKPEPARQLLRAFAERSKTSDPWVQLAQFELTQRNYDGMAQAIAQLRSRWKEASSADLLDAQLALASRRDYRTASQFLEAALKKDPENKVALFWKAQIDEFIGAGTEATKVYEGLVRDKPVKELDANLSLYTAAQWALATQALDNREIDTAIDRLGELLRNGGASNSTLARAIRWKLADAYTAKGQWPAARTEIIALLKDPAATTDERVRAANFFRNNKEEANAVTLLDSVLKVEPGNGAAVVVRAYMLSESGKPDQAVALVRRALATGSQPPGVHLMLAAIENVMPPKETATQRALAAIDGGLQAHTDATDLIRAKYKMLLNGERADALSYLAATTQNAQSVEVRRFLADSYRELGEFSEAEKIARDLIRDEPKNRPKDPALVALLVRIMLNQAAVAADQGNPTLERATDDKTAALIRQARADFPQEVSFPRAEWELVMRRRDLKRAMAITQEIDTLAPRSTLGPMLRSQIYAAQERTPEVAQSYAEAVEREPRRLDVKLLLAQTQLSLGKPDEALRLASGVLESDKAQTGGVLLKARALAAIPGPAAQVASRRAEAIALLKISIKEQPKFRDAYHAQAEIEMSQGQRAEAAATLEAGLKANADDATGLALLAQTLTETRDHKSAPSPADLARAKAIAESYGGKDTKGQRCLALAIGFQRARQYDLAAPWAEKAAGLIDSPAVHQTYGDILLAQAEHTSEPDQALDVFRLAIAEYDLVLKNQATSIEAVNNKAWILHRYLNDNAAALELAEGLLRRSDPSTLLPEFLDTLGSIQETAGKPKEAEESYNRGLRKNPEHPFLNFHMGRLMAADNDRRGQALPYLRKAEEVQDRLPPTMVSELKTLIERVGR